MKCIVEMSLGAIIYIPSFIKTGSAIRKFEGGGIDDTQRALRCHKRN
jgi:hypothetical protein